MTFRPSKLTPGYNLMWESSRMMLPEHVSTLQKRKREKQKRIKPEFDEQYLSELATKIAEAKQEEYTVLVSVFDEYEDVEVIGQITYIDQQLRRLKLEHADDIEWIHLDDILYI